MLRKLRLGSGRETILRVIGRSANDPADSSQSDDPWISSAQLASALLMRLSRCLEPLRRRHSLSDWVDVLSSVTNELGWTSQDRSTTSESAQRLTDTDLQELDLFQRILRTAAEADQAIAGKKSGKTMSLEEFATELGDLLERETLPAESEPTGCIRILDVEQIRNLDVPHLFVMGLTEDSFPRNRTDDCLFSESERQEFISRGIRLSHRSQQHADEMLLFYSIMTGARRSLTLSSPVVNSKGQPVYQSPYLRALIELFDPKLLVETCEGKLDPVPSIEHALTRKDLRLAATVKARDGEPGLYRALLDQEAIRRTCLNTLAAIDVAVQRFHQRGFTEYEGRLELAQNLDRIRKRFGPGHQFSATELEAYARCPFQFWMSNVLNIEPLETVEERTDFALRGTLLHDVLAKLVAEQSLDDPQMVVQRFRELVDERLGREIAQTELQKALIGLERAILAEWAKAFSSQQADYREKVDDHLKDIHPLAPEIPFGNLPDQTVAEGGYPPILFGEGSKTVNVRGRIDRVDVGKVEGKPAYIVLDYKTGHRPSTRLQDLASGRSIQLALYLIAAKRLGLAGADAVPFQMGYWALRETGFRQALGKFKFAAADAGEIQKLESILDALLPQLADEIRAGRFVVENEDQDCGGRCAFRTVCRVNQIRPVADALNKKSAVRLSLQDFENDTEP
jgi:ATP-dependent helicase/DNAse subunit B